MKKPLVVKEFDRITCNVDYQNDTDIKYLDESTFKDFVKFIEEFSATEENADALDCLKITYQRGPGQVITTKNYVGLVQMKNGQQVEILPKISIGGIDDTDNKTTKTTFIKMLRCMDDFKNKVFNAANLGIDRMNLYEIFINMYIQEAENLVKHGLKSTYVSEEDNLSVLKGKLNVKKHVVKNAVHKEKFLCIFDEYSANRPENKLIKSTLLKLNEISVSAENKKRISRVLDYFELVDESRNYDSDFSLVSIDRSMNEYVQLMKWSKIFLKNKSFTTFSGDSLSRALLFPMDKLFEAYVAKNMAKEFNSSGLNVSAQDHGYYLFNTPSDQFALRPDIVITKPDGTQIIMDTKWKSLIDNERKNYGINQHDMYQMYAYSKKYGTPDIWLLYPVNDEMRGHSQIKFTSDDGVNVTIFFVDVTDISKSLAELKTLI